MWEFYLAGSEAAFRWQDLMVFQIQMAKSHEAVPITRDYIHEVEHAPPRKAPAHRRRSRA